MVINVGGFLESQKSAAKITSRRFFVQILKRITDQASFR